MTKPIITLVDRWRADANAAKALIAKYEAEASCIAATEAAQVLLNCADQLEAACREQRESLAATTFCAIEPIGVAVMIRGRCISDLAPDQEGE